MKLPETEVRKEMSDAFDKLGISLEDAKKDFERVQKFGNRDGRVCICGHAMGYHAFIDARGVYKCNAQKQSCPCKSPRPVLITSNTRVFTRKTHGSGGLHALTQGIVAALEVGGTVEWDIELACDKCGEVKPVVPCPVSQNGTVRNEATGWDKMLCRECRTGE